MSNINHHSSVKIKDKIGQFMESFDKRIVIKIGTSTLTAGTSKLNLPQITSLAHQVSTLLSRGAKVALVSSGAIAVGGNVWERPRCRKPSRETNAGGCWSAAPDERLRTIVWNLRAESGAGPADS
jgi:hypothetical protein